MSDTGLNVTWMTTTALSKNAPDFGNEIMDSYFNRNKTLAAIQKYGGVEDRNSGGEFTWPISKEGGIGQWFSRTDKLSDNQSDPVTTSTWRMKFFQVPVKVYWTDEVENRQSKTKIFDYTKALQDVAKDTAEYTIDSALWAASSASNQPFSIPELVNTTGTVGGLAQNAWTDQASANGWASLNTSTYSFASAGLDNMNDTLIQLYNRSANTDVIFMGQSVYQYYFKSAEDKHVLMNNGTNMGFGIGKIPYAGIPVDCGPNVTDNGMFFLDLKTFRVRRNKGATTMTEWMQMENEPAKKAHYMHCLAFYCKSRRRNAYHDTITA